MVRKGFRFGGLAGLMLLGLTQVYNVGCSVSIEPQEYEQRIAELEKKVESRERHELYIEKVFFDYVNNDNLPDVVIKFSNDYKSNCYINNGDGTTRSAGRID